MKANSFEQDAYEKVTEYTPGMELADALASRRVARPSGASGVAIACSILGAAVLVVAALVSIAILILGAMKQ